MKKQATASAGGFVAKVKSGDINLSEYFVFLCLVILCVILSVISPVFLTSGNITNVLLQTSINGIVAIGMTMVILTGGIDLSIGSVVAVCGISLGLVYKNTGSVDGTGIAVLLIIMVLIIGPFIGFVNGFLIAKTKLPPFIATLGMMSIGRGTALALSGSRPITKIPSLINFIGNGQIGPIYVPIIIMLAAYLLAWWVLKHTKLGRSIYATGGNMEAARLSGINVDRTLIATYTISGLAAAAASIVLVGRLATAQPTAGTGYEMDAIAAAVIGGSSMTGGEGRVMGTLIGALLIAVIKNGLNLLNFSTYVQQIVTGAVIIVAVMSDTMRKKG